MTNTDAASVKYPECEKMSAVRHQSQAIGEFLEWMRGGEGLVLAEYVTVLDPDVRYCVELGKNRGREVWKIRDLDPGMSDFVGGYWESQEEAEQEVVELEAERLARAQGNQKLFPAYRSIEQLLARFFGIDLDKVEAERRQMLAELQGGA